MDDNKDKLKSDMINKIFSGGAWFTTREGNYLKIVDAASEDRLYAKTCIVSHGKVTGRAYSFGTDWFDISFHGRLTDIYIDPDTLKIWEADDGSMPMQLKVFAENADAEAAEGISGAFSIDSAGFAEELLPSEAKMGRTGGILSKVDLSSLNK